MPPLNLKLAVCLQNIESSKFNGQIPLDKPIQNIENSKSNGQKPLDKLKLNQKSYHNLQNSEF